MRLITREAFALYFRRLAPGGVLAAHITNRYLDLAPVVAAGCAASGRRAWVERSAGDPERGTEDAAWAVSAGTASAAPDAFTVWTDDYSNLLAVLRR